MAEWMQWVFAFMKTLALKLESGMEVYIHYLRQSLTLGKRKRDLYYIPNNSSSNGQNDGYRLGNSFFSLIRYTAVVLLNAPVIGLHDSSFRKKAGILNADSDLRFCVRPDHNNIILKIPTYNNLT